LIGLKVYMISLQLL